MFVARRHWTVERDSRRYDVDMADEYFLGHRVVRVNGELAYEGRTVLSDHTGAYQFDLGGSPAFLRIRTNGFTYSYDLIVDGRSFETGKPLELKGQELRPHSSPSLTILSGVFFGGLLVFGVFFVGERLTTDAAVAVVGLDAEGIIAAKRVEHHRNGDSYVLEYRFATPSATYPGRIYVGDSEYRSASVGDAVRIAYFGPDPTINGRRPSLGDVAADLVLAGFLIAVPLWVSVRAIAAGVHELRAAPRVRDLGIETTGNVIAVSTLRGRYMNVTGWQIEYRYQDGEGREWRGSSPSYGEAAIYRWPIGSPVRVRFDPGHPADSQFLG